MAFLHRLTFAKLKALTRPGRYADGGGLYFQVSKFNTRAWIFQFNMNGKVRQHGLGGFPIVSLSEARDRASDLRKLVRNGVDPIAQRKVDARRAAKFRDVAAAYIEKQQDGWRNAKHRQQWTNTLMEYVYPVIGDVAVSDIDKALILKVLEPIWREKPETADRVRSRIEKVLDAAKSDGMRTGDNPAVWKANLQHDLPSPSKLRKVRHHPALPYAQMPVFMAELRSRDSVSARALEFTVLCAARTTATVGATWNEFDLPAKLWTVSATRAGVKIEGSEPRLVPLSDRCVEILKSLPRETGNPHVFIGGKPGASLSNMAMAEVLKDVRKGVTVHGMRSTFKDWAAECTAYENIVSEAALWHVVADKVEAAYRRGALLDKRRRLMRDWARHCSQPAKTSTKIFPLRKLAR